MSRTSRWCSAATAASSAWTTREGGTLFGLGGSEIGLVFLIILLIFGPSQIPKMARGLGQALREFRKAQREITDEVNREEPPAEKPGDTAGPKSG
jgi:sec-independent protein translocase protein TatA